MATNLKKKPSNNVLDKESSESEPRNKRVCRDRNIERLGIGDVGDTPACSDVTVQNLHNTNLESIESVAILSDDESDVQKNTEVPPDYGHLVGLITKLIFKVDELQKQLINIEVKVNHIHDIGKPASGVVDVTKLNKFGLPVKTQSELQKLEQQLSIEIDKQELVSLFT